jgi:competence protein ComEA
MLKRVMGLVLVLGLTMAFGMSIKEVNKASKEELMQIKGIGEKKADAIMKARKKEKFKNFEALEQVKGVGPALVENIKKDVKAKEQKKETKKKHAKKEKK